MEECATPEIQEAETRQMKRSPPLLLTVKGRAETISGKQKPRKKQSAGFLIEAETSHPLQKKCILHGGMCHPEIKRRKPGK
ncbi:hypothetical protein CEXT_672971 [Caerostris extrusa]|uniref:Uncharacterized protein n=1 Tax=Caerostris extrusa TaxID=172846 RepID=A0AAV4T4C1_CAEEX|nr:hypothetical protein CEXT_672971 [Caerostris extrusa]